MTRSPDATWTNRAAKAILLIRILVAWVFLSEGIQKFLFHDALGVGRFVKIGIPWPQVMAPFVGVVEIVCGSLLLIGLMTRLAAIPLLIDICVALYSTKIVTYDGQWPRWFVCARDAVACGDTQSDRGKGDRPVGKLGGKSLCWLRKPPVRSARETSNSTGCSGRKGRQLIGST